MVVVAGLPTTKEGKPQYTSTVKASQMLLSHWLKQVKWLSPESESREIVYILIAGVAKLQRLCIQGPVDKLGTIAKTMNHTSYFMSDFVLNLVLYPYRIPSYSLFHVSLPLLVLFFLLKIYATTHYPSPHHRLIS